jgi:hypothetical protein
LATIKAWDEKEIEMRREEKIELALGYLKRLIASGWEYPDAEYQAAKKYGLKGQEINDLRADYDKGL